MILWKCCTHYASKFGKLSSGYRTGKGQFSFQFQRRAMPKKVQTTTQFYSFHMLARPCSKSVKLVFNSPEFHTMYSAYKLNPEFHTMYSAAAAKSLQSCPTLCDPIDSSPPGSAVPGILQARTLEWVAISFSNAWKWKSESEVAQSCLTLCDPMDWKPTRLLCPWDIPGKSTGVGCHCLLRCTLHIS